jgi:hypothetical protein
MATVVIPLTSDPNQTFKAKVPIGGNNVSLSYEVRYSEVPGYWLMNIFKDGAPLIAAIPLIPGDWPAGNILGQYKYLGIGNAYIAPVDKRPKEEWPGADTLGSGWLLIWSDEGQEGA